MKNKSGVPRIGSFKPSPTLAAFRSPLLFAALAVWSVAVTGGDAASPPLSEGPQWSTLYEDTMGLGRVALKPPVAGQPVVRYTTHGDRRILRHQERNGDEWEAETVCLGPQGPRGVVAGSFGESPDIETVATFGYSKGVELLTRTINGWQVEMLFEDLDKGHWLATAELDGRNGTREIITSGYSGRMVLLSRPAGFGRKELAVSAGGGEHRLATEFRESFDQPVGALPPGWRAAQTGAGKPVWQIVTDDSAGKRTVLKQSGVADYPLCILTNATVRDGFVATLFKPLTGEKDQAGGVVWRYRDADNYYICRANALENNVVLYKVQGGKRSSLNIVGRAVGYGVEARVSKTDWNRLRVEFSGATHKVFLNGRHLFDVEDATFSESGHVGLWTKADSVTLFEDFCFGGADAER